LNKIVIIIVIPIFYNTKNYYNSNSKAQDTLKEKEQDTKWGTLTSYFNDVCYADDAVLMADSEDKLQRFFHSFNQSAKQLNMLINTDKTKCLVSQKSQQDASRRMVEHTHQKIVVNK